MSGIINSAGSRSGVIGTTELDYEEGAWTPTVIGATSGSLNLNYVVGTYVKIGKLVHVNAKFSVTSNNSLVGQIKIDALPFASQAAYDAGMTWGSVDGLMAMAGYQMTGNMVASDNVIGLRKNAVIAGGDVASMVLGDINHDGNTTYGPGTRWNPQFSFTYEVA